MSRTSPFGWMCVMGGDSQVQFGEYRLSSSRGVQQGDPLGPALFALAIHEPAREARLSAEEYTGRLLDWGAFYLDDGFAGGVADVLSIFASNLAQSWARSGWR